MTAEVSRGTRVHELVDIVLANHLSAVAGEARELRPLAQRAWPACSGEWP